MNLWPTLTGGEVIDLLGRLRGSDHNAELRDDLIERFELDPTKKIRSHSRGNRQKVSLIAALSSNAELLLLDEPTVGLDPLMAESFCECIDDERRSGRTVLLSSHTLAEVEALCELTVGFFLGDGRPRHLSLYFRLHRTPKLGDIACVAHLRSSSHQPCSRPLL